MAPKEDVGSPLEYLASNLQGIGARENQEDSFGFGSGLDAELIKARGLLAVVADGMGGMEGGKRASETTVETIIRDYGRFDFEDDIPPQLEEAVFHANEQVLRALEGRGGSTVIAALIYDERLYYCSVGDSYLFLLRDHALYRLNRSHNLECQTILDGIYVGEFDPEAGARAPQKEALTHFLGQRGLDETDLFHRPLKLVPGDVILLCSDGVGGALSFAEIEDCLRHGVPADMCAALETAVRNRNLVYQDNYTALVIQCRKQ